MVALGELKNKKRRGWVLHQIKDPETTAEHIFHLAILVWVLGEKKKLNVERAIKIVLIHDLCEVYAPDLTPYDPLLPKDKKKIMEVLKKWPQFTPVLKVKKEKEKSRLEKMGMNRLVASLPQDLKKEIKALWKDLEKGLTKEARFVKQADKVINFFQGMSYWKKYGKIQHKLWIRWIKENVDDPVLLDFVKVLENKFCQNSK